MSGPRLSRYRFDFRLRLIKTVNARSARAYAQTQAELSDIFAGKFCIKMANQTLACAKFLKLYAVVNVCAHCWPSQSIHKSSARIRARSSAMSCVMYWML